MSDRPANRWLRLTQAEHQSDEDTGEIQTPDLPDGDSTERTLRWAAELLRDVARRQQEEGYLSRAQRNLVRARDLDEQAEDEAVASRPTDRPILWCPIDGTELQARTLPQPGKHHSCPSCGLWWP